MIQLMGRYVPWVWRNVLHDTTPLPPDIEIQHRGFVVHPGGVWYYSAEVQSDSKGYRFLNGQWSISQLCSVLESNLNVKDDFYHKPNYSGFFSPVSC